MSVSRIHVQGVRGPSGAMAASMAGHSPAAVQHLHRVSRQPDIHRLTNQDTRDTVMVGGNFDVVIESDS